MSQLLAGASPRWGNLQLERLVLGEVRTKSWTLPASATTNTLFTVSAGNVLITSLIGIVTTTIGTTATTLALGTAPTTGTAETAGIATATAVTSLEKGTWLGVQASAGLAGALVSGGHAGSTAFASVPFAAAPGAITATTSANAGAGVILWYLSFVPLDGQAAGTVTAA